MFVYGVTSIYIEHKYGLLKSSVEEVLSRGGNDSNDNEKHHSSVDDWAGGLW